jgi:hypothetical protein
MELVDFVSVQIHLSLAVAQQHVHFEVVGVVEPIRNAKITEHFIFEWFDAEFRVAEYDVVVVVGDGPLALLAEEGLFLGEGHDETDVGSAGLGKEGALAVGGEVVPVAETDNEHDMAVAVEVVVEVDLVQGVVLVEQFGLADGPVGEWLDLRD